MPDSNETQPGGSWKSAVYHNIMDPTTFYDGSCFQVSAYTHIGGRKTQEDRFAVSPMLLPNTQDCAFFGVFDGTVGDFASDNIKELIVPRLLASPHWKELAGRLRPSPDGQTRTPGERLVRLVAQDEDRETLQQAMLGMYKETDEALLKLCAQEQKHYAVCTSVTAVLVGGLLAVAHLGDSRIAMGRDPKGPEESSAPVIGEFATVDHKPDTADERKRIESCGGSIEYLHNHNNKPFIRGGDFTMRKALQEKPMQLQYSRAFGGKDLKMFGLSNTPDVSIFRINPNTRWVILASDGLWDVCNAQQAVMVAHEARKAGRSPSEALVRAALQEQERRNSNADNVTAVCVYFHEKSGR